MKENKFIENLKSEICNNVQQISLDNALVQKEIIEKQLEIIRLLKEIEDLTIEDQNATNLETNINSKENLTTETHPPENRTEIIENKKTYIFERKLRGGIVPHPNIDGYVPEGIVRKLGLEHGDLLYATPKYSAGRQNHYIYELAEKGERIAAPGRIQYECCQVKMEAGRYVVEKSEKTGDYIRFNEGLYTVLINENDVEEYSLVEGDLIDIAYQLDHPESARVIWKHQTEIDHAEGYNVSKSIKKINKKKERDIDQTLQGKTILVIGNEPEKQRYKASIEERGGNFLWGDSKDDLTRVEAKVRKANLVVFLLKVSGHIGMEHIKRLCKEYNVPFEPTWSLGKSTVINLAEESPI